MSVKQLKKDVKILNRALNLGPQPEWKKRHEETLQLLRGIERLHNAFEQLPLEEQERQIQDLKSFPATDFVHGDPEMLVYAEAIKSATIRDLESLNAHARNRMRWEDDESVDYP